VIKLRAVAAAGLLRSLGWVGGRVGSESRPRQHGARIFLAVFLLMLFVSAARAELLWKPDVRDDLFLSVSAAADGKLSIFIADDHVYQKAIDTGFNYAGEGTATEYIEVFATPVANPALRFGWRSRSVIFLYPLSVFDAKSTDGKNDRVMIRSNGENYLVVITGTPGAASKTK
jgi:hypothetical protein